LCRPSYTLTNDASKGRPGNARDISRKFIFLLTDGNANVNANHQASLTNATILASARQHAISRAQAAAALGIRIYTVTVGADADQALMEIFIRLGRTRPVELIK
jgi:hypothetical protein